MDPIESINPAKDSTLAILLAAQAGAGSCTTPSSATCGCAMASPGAGSRRSRSWTIAKRWFVRGARVPARLGEFDVILMRKDPPFDTEYIYSTYILDRAERAGRAGRATIRGACGT